MVVAEQFAWAHLPKTGGTAAQAMFCAVPDLVLRASPTDSNDKHDAFWQHEDEIDGKLRVMTIRRLPSWMLSAAHHKASSGLWPDFEPLPMPSVEEMVANTGPDDMLRWMTDADRLSVDRWLRTECLAEDVAALLDDLGLLDDAARRAIAAVPFVAKAYDHDPANTFTPANMRRIYETNPGWAAIEERVYGDVHELAAA